jgi:hypothetical protein
MILGGLHATATAERALPLPNPPPWGEGTNVALCAKQISAAFNIVMKKYLF